MTTRMAFQLLQEGGVRRETRIIPTLSQALLQAPDRSRAEVKAVVYQLTIEPRGTGGSEGPHETKRFRYSLTSQHSFASVKE